jgi:hypothetical protein
MGKREKARKTKGEGKKKKRKKYKKNARKERFKVRRMERKGDFETVSCQNVKQHFVK